MTTHSKYAPGTVVRLKNDPGLLPNWLFDQVVGKKLVVVTDDTDRGAFFTKPNEVRVLFDGFCANVPIIALEVA